MVILKGILDPREIVSDRFKIRLKEGYYDYFLAVVLSGGTFKYQGCSGAEWKKSG